MTEQKTKQYKLDAVGRLRERFKDKRSFIFTDYRGLTVHQITDLRKKLRNDSVEYLVVKNNFARLAFKELSAQGLDAYLEGPTAVAIVRDEVGPPTKTIMDFAKESSVKLKGGLVDGDVFDQKKLEAFSRLPSRKELIAQLMGTMNAAVQKLMFTLKAVAEKMGGQQS